MLPCSLTTSRRALRRAVEIPCDVVSPYVDAPLLYWATDLTPHGVWLESRIPMHVGERVVLCFQPPVWWAGAELMIFAEVTRVIASRDGREGGMGLEFLDLEERDAIELARWLEGRPPRLPLRRERDRERVVLPTPRHLLH